MPLYEITTNAPKEDEEVHKEVRSVLADVSGFLGELTKDANGVPPEKAKELADRVERALATVVNYEPPAKRMVEADSASQAIRHCAQGLFSARTIGKPAEVAQLMTSGITLEKAKGE